MKAAQVFYGRQSGGRLLLRNRQLQRVGTHGGGGLSDRSLKGGKGFADGLLGGLLLEGDLDQTQGLMVTSLGPARILCRQGG